MASPIPNDTFPFRLFFLLFTAIALLIFAGAWCVGSERIASELEITRSNEIRTVVMGGRTFVQATVVDISGRTVRSGGHDG